jgi:outer membrane protein TolC
LVLDQTTALTTDYHQIVFQYYQQFITGTSAQLTFMTNHSLQNTPVNLFNPYITGFLDLQINQPLLQGFKIGVNNRDIRIAKNNMKVSNLQLKLQVATTISAALNLYWDLVSFVDSVRIKEQALATSQKLYDDDRKMVKIGSLPAVEVTRAAAQVSIGKEDLLFAQTNVQQQEIVLKNALSRNAMANAWLDDVHIVPLDPIEVPKTDELKALAGTAPGSHGQPHRIEQSKVNIDSQKIAIRGSRNGLLPTLQAFAELTNNGLSGPVNSIYNNCCGTPDPYFIGGTGNALAQVFRRDFPNYSAGLTLNIPFRNRQAQADYVTDQLQLRQAELRLQRAANQVTVDVKTALIGVQQARARYETAVDTRKLAEQSLKDEQNRFQHGVSSVTLVIQAQRDLANDEDAEVQAMANYTHAKIAFDMAMGRTLDVNRISMQEAVSGHVARESVMPESLPDEKKQEVQQMKSRNPLRARRGLLSASLPLCRRHLFRAGPASCHREGASAGSYPLLCAPDGADSRPEQLEAVARSAAGRQAIPDGAGCAGAGDREQSEPGSGPLRTAAGAVGAGAAKAGGPLRGVPSAAAQVASVDSGLGVNGSIQAAGLSSGGGGSSGGSRRSNDTTGRRSDAELGSGSAKQHDLRALEPAAVIRSSQRNALFDPDHTYLQHIRPGRFPDRRLRTIHGL